MTLKLTHEGYPENDIGCLSGPRKTKEKGSTNGSTFTPLYNGIKDSYGVDSIGYCWVIGVLEGTQLLSGSPALTADSCGFPTRCVGSKTALVRNRFGIKLAHVHRISQSRILYRILSCFAEPKEAAEFLTYKRGR